MDLRAILRVLKYTNGKRASHATIERYFVRWREMQATPRYRCDNPECTFHKGELTWNGKALRMRLDHLNGVNTDNRPENLRFLCPNCDSQLPTSGGGNKGLVKKHDRGFAVLRSRGGAVSDQTVFIEPAVAVAKATAPMVSLSPASTPNAPSDSGTNEEVSDQLQTPSRSEKE